MGQLELGVSFPNNSVVRIAESATTAENLGFDSLWVNDDVVGFSQPDAMDVFLCMASMADATKTSRIGSCVVATYRHHPVNLAMSLVALDHLSRGRLVAGLGSGGVNDKLGYPMIVPVLRRFEEIVKVLKLLFQDEEVSFEGRCFRLESARLTVKSLQRPHPSLWLAANTPASVRMIGGIADGWIPTITTPEIYRDELSALISEAERRGRKAENITPACLQFINISKSRQDSLQRVREDLAVTLDWFGGLRARRLRAEKSITSMTGLLEKLHILGSVEDCSERLGEFFDAGVRHMILQPFPNAEVPAMLDDILQAGRSS